jgi:hypothetical protein
VALLTPGLEATEVALARAGLEASGVEVRIVGAEDLPIVGAPAALAAARREAEAALDEAHAAFVATRFAEARATAATAEQRARVWGGDRRVARTLADLALVSAQSGDASAVARAAGYAPEVTLDAARFSPTLRQAFTAAQARLRALPRVDVEVTSAPAGATLFVDGEAVGLTPTRAAITRGRHALALSHPGFATLAEELDADGAPVHRALAALDDDARLAQLHMRLADGERVSNEEVALAAERFACDGAMALSGHPPRASLAGPHVAAAAFDAGARSLSDVAATIGQHVQTECALTHSPPERGRAAAPLTLKVMAGACVARVRASLRVDDHALAERSAPIRDGAAVLAISDLPSSTRPYNLEYRLWGESALGHPVGAFGSAAAPLRVPIEADRTPPPPPRHWYQRWWIWTLAAGAVTSAVVIPAVALRRPPSDARLVGP